MRSYFLEDAFAIWPGNLVHEVRSAGIVANTVIASQRYKPPQGFWHLLEIEIHHRPFPFFFAELPVALDETSKCFSFNTSPDAPCLTPQSIEIGI